MGGGAKIFQFFAGEDIQSSQVNFGMTVLPSLRSRHVNDLARAALDHHKSVFAQGRALHGVGSRSAGIGTIEGVLMLIHVLISYYLDTKPETVAFWRKKEGR